MKLVLLFQNAYAFHNNALDRTHWNAVLDLTATKLLEDDVENLLLHQGNALEMNLFVEMIDMFCSPSGGPDLNLSQWSDDKLDTLIEPLIVWLNRSQKNDYKAMLRGCTCPGKLYSVIEKSSDYSERCLT